MGRYYSRVRLRGSGKKAPIGGSRTRNITCISIFTGGPLGGDRVDILSPRSVHRSACAAQTWTFELLDTRSSGLTSRADTNRIIRFSPFEDDRRTLPKCLGGSSETPNAGQAPFGLIGSAANASPPQQNLARILSSYSKIKQIE